MDRRCDDPRPNWGRILRGRAHRASQGPRELAETAVAAWEREDPEEVDLDNETHTDRVERHRAGALALLGLALSERGVPDDGTVSVPLDPWVVGSAIDAADKRGLLLPP